jgi:hypothetical protein
MLRHPASRKFRDMNNVVICAILKNEARYLAEWIEYHKMIGVEYFYIYNNNSEDAIEEICDAYRDCVTLINWPLHANQQMLAYKDYVKNYSSRAYWTAFIDGDEFIVYKGSDNLIAYLRDHKDKNALLMKWVIFGTNGHVTPPAGLVTENYLMTHSICPNPYWKSICQAEHIDVDNIVTPHHFTYMTDQPVLPAADSSVVIYHYMLRSKEDVLRKVSRGDAWSLTESEKKKRNVQASAQAYLKKYDNTDLYDDYMLIFQEELRNRLSAKGFIE